MRTFKLHRIEDVSCVSGTGDVAEGAIFGNGKVAIGFISQWPSVIVYDSMADMVAVHGHGGRTEVRYDAPPLPVLKLDKEVKGAGQRLQLWWMRQRCHHDDGDKPTRWLFTHNGAGKMLVYTCRHCGRERTQFI